MSRTSGHVVRRDEQHRGSSSGPPASSSGSPGDAAGATTERQRRVARSCVTPLTPRRSARQERAPRCLRRLSHRRRHSRAVRRTDARGHWTQTSTAADRAAACAWRGQAAGFRRPALPSGQHVELVDRVSSRTSRPMIVPSSASATQHSNCARTCDAIQLRTSASEWTGAGMRSRASRRDRSHTAAAGSASRWTAGRISKGSIRAAPYRQRQAAHPRRPGDGRDFPFR